MVPSHRPAASRRACSPSGMRFWIFVSSHSMRCLADFWGMVAAGVNPAAKATLDKYERNPDGSLSSAGRFATGLLSLRCTNGGRCDV